MEVVRCEFPSLPIEFDQQRTFVIYGTRERGPQLLELRQGRGRVSLLIEITSARVRLGAVLAGSRKHGRYCCAKHGGTEEGRQEQTGSAAKPIPRGRHLAAIIFSPP
jgi:hypothetical protein